MVNILCQLCDGIF